ncbi:MAG: TIGR03790 family protein [Armatimonadetes bacterium]|nr:TIGR03790 family protein [Armatimonadota bacterium]
MRLVLGPEPLQVPADSKRVLVVINLASDDSKAVGSAYVKARSIPHSNVVTLTASLEEKITAKEFRETLEGPIREKIKALKPKPDFIVLARGLPLKYWDKATISVDAGLSTMEIRRDPITTIKDEAQVRSWISPYFGKNEPFSSEKFGFYLVTRLDGYSLDDAKALIQNSMNAKPSKGPFLIDVDPGRVRPGYDRTHDTLIEAVKVLRKKGFAVEFDESDKFVSGSSPAMGYASWGSNDGHYLISNYKAIKFQPGAIGETFVSTSARTFKPVTSGQSVITDLIHSGITGIKGYVDEPYTLAMAHPDILFDRYTSGYTLAESFYMASMMLKWKDLVVGDPICRPYAAAGSSK